MCDGKSGYQTRPAAKAAVRSMRRSNRGKLFAYNCPLCEFYHIGHRILGLAAYDDANRRRNRDG